MKHRLFLGCSALAFAALGATTANAENFGYFQLHGGYEWGWSVNYNPGPSPAVTWSDRQFGGSARVATVTPNFSFQTDTWTGLAFVGGNVDGIDWGTGAHATWRSSNGGMMFGAFGTVGGGGFNDGIFGNAGLEAVLSAERWRVYWQGGLVRALTGTVQAEGERDLYTTVALSYFLTPDFFVTGNIGVDRWSNTNGDTSTEFVWGAKLEFRAPGSAASVFVSFESFRFYSAYGLSPDYDRGVDNIVFVGIRLPLGGNSLRDLQNGVGLADLNPVYGDLINR